jgi:hypothetical protein
MMEDPNSGRAVFSVSDYSQLGPLHDYLRSAVPEVHVSRIAGQPGTGNQGTLDVLAVLVSSSGLIAAIKASPCSEPVSRAGRLAADPDVDV